MSFLKSLKEPSCISFLEMVKLFKRTASEVHLEMESIFIKDFLKSFVLPFKSFPSDIEIERMFEGNLIYYNSKVLKKKWKMKEKLLLLWIVYYFMKFNKKSSYEEIKKSDWNEIGSFLNKSSVETVFKFHSLLNCHTQKSEWSQEENDVLFSVVSTLQSKNSESFKWVDATHLFYERSPSSVFRDQNSCREQWIQHLDMSLKKSPWTLEEDAILVREYLKNGAKWSHFASELPGRNCYSVKNRFVSLCKKFKIKESPKNFQREILEQALQLITARKKVHLNDIPRNDGICLDSPCFAKKTPAQTQSFFTNFSFSSTPFESETSLNGSFESFYQKDLSNMQLNLKDDNSFYEDKELVDKYLAC